MHETSARLDLPYIQPSQAQKHVTHNEALRQLDGVVQLSVAAFDAQTPPPLPETGEIHALGAAPTGDWAGQADMLAIRDETAWRFVAPAEGWRAWGQAEADLRVRHAGAWVAVVDLQDLDGVGIGIESNAGNPLAVAGPATLLTHDGAGHRLKLNKAAAGETASLLYQSAWNGHAEIGLCGDNDLHVKVSGDGTTWQEALTVDGVTGELSGTAVQSGITDDTAGRVLKMGNRIGPFDLGSSRSSIISGSLDDVQNGGVTRFMCWNADATEVPWNYGVGLQIMGWDTTGNQLAFRRGGAPTMAFRGTVNSTPDFSSWFELYHTGNVVGTVSANPGVGAALLERGSNANGDYARFADGTQICTHTLTLAAPSTAMGAGFGGAGDTAWVFPAAFATGSQPAVQACSDSDTAILVGAAVGSHSSAALRAMRFVSSATAPTVRATAIGRWK